MIMGDDGYGPAVVDELNAHYNLSDDVQAVDVGTAVREYLFDYILSVEGRPDTIIILDAVDLPNRQPGEISRFFHILFQQKRSTIFLFISFPL